MAAIDLGKHQLKAIKELKNGAILKGGVGTGKTRTALGYYYLRVCDGRLKVNGKGRVAPMRTPRDVYVITTARKRDELDWEKEAAKFGLSPLSSLSPSGVSLKVDSWNNIEKYEGVKDAFFIFDEQRLVGSGAWVQAFIKIAKQNEWILLSATPGDSWMDYIPVFVANGFYKNRTEFIRTHVVWKNFSKFPSVERFVEVQRLLHHKADITVDMPMERHTRRHINYLITDYNKEQFDLVYKKRWHIYEDRPIKDVGELFRVMRKLVNSDPSRVLAVKKLMEKHERLILFYNFDYELEALREIAKAYPDYDFAEWNGHKHEAVPTSEKWLYLVQYTAGSEAWNCITTDALAFYSQNYSWKVSQQSLGRIDRLNTKYVDLHYYIFKSNSMIDNAIAKSLETKKDFNEKEFMRGQDPTYRPPTPKASPGKKSTGSTRPMASRKDVRRSPRASAKL